MISAPKCLAALRTNTHALPRVAGVPNTGKSSLINSLRVSCGLSRVAAVGAVPGITRTITMFPISKVCSRRASATAALTPLQAPPTYVIDTPGIMMPAVTKWSTAAALAAVGCISIGRIDALSVLSFCLRRARSSSPASARSAAAGGGSCLCQFILQKSKVSDAADAEVSAVAVFPALS